MLILFKSDNMMLQNGNLENRNILMNEAYSEKIHMPINVHILD